MKRRSLLTASLLFLGALALFWPGRREFILLDDDRYILDNPRVAAGLTGEGALWAFTSVGHESNWHPLTWISHMADVQFFGLDPRGHHLTSALLHALSAALLFLVLEACTGAAGASLLVAALFAAHPLRVESVAWAAERKDVLAGLFWMLTLLAYAAFARRPGRGRLLLVALALALGLMAKPTLVAAPFVLLLLDYWPLGRLGRLGGPAAPGAPRSRILEKLPLLALSAAAAAVTLVAQYRDDTVVPLRLLSIPQRLANAAVSAAGYLAETLWPTRLAVYYPYPERGHAAPVVVFSLLLITAFTALALHRLRRSPWLATGWFWYLVTLVPVIGLVQTGHQAMADRYTYVPQIGVFVAAAWGTASLAGRGVRRAALAAAGAALVLFSAAASRAQLAWWQDSSKLFERTLAVTRDNWLIEHNLALFLVRQGRFAEAEPHVREALRVNPGDSEVRIVAGNVLQALGKTGEAAEQYRRASELHPGGWLPRFNLATALAELGRDDEALMELERVLALNPELPEAHLRLGELLERLGRADDAAARYREALRLRPAFPEARRRLAGLRRPR